MKIFFVIDCPRAGVKARQAVSLLTELKAVRPKIHVISTGRGDFSGEALSSKSIPIRHVGRSKNRYPTPLYKKIDGITGLSPLEAVQVKVGAGKDSFELVILATLTEGTANAIMKYMVLGEPLITTDGGRSCELVTGGVMGWLVSLRNCAAPVKRIKYFIDRPEEAATFGARGRDRTQQAFGYENLIEYTKAVYRVLVSANRTNEIHSAKVA